MHGDCRGEGPTTGGRQPSYEATAFRRNVSSFTERAVVWLAWRSLGVWKDSGLSAVESRPGSGSWHRHLRHKWKKAPDRRPGLAETLRKGLRGGCLQVTQLAS